MPATRSCPTAGHAAHAGHRRQRRGPLRPRRAGRGAGWRRSADGPAERCKRPAESSTAAGPSRASTCSICRSTTASSRWRSACRQRREVRAARAARRSRSCSTAPRSRTAACASRPGMVYHGDPRPAARRPSSTWASPATARWSGGRASCWPSWTPRLRDRLPAEHGRPKVRRADRAAGAPASQARPQTPIVLVEDRTYTNAAFVPSHRADRARQPGRASQGAYEHLTPPASSTATTSGATRCWATTAKRPPTARIPATWAWCAMRMRTRRSCGRSWVRSDYSSIAESGIGILPVVPS